MDERIENLLDREELTLAPVFKRFIAFIIDNFIMSVLFIIIIWNSFAKVTTTVEMIAVTNSFILEYIVLKVIYHTLFVFMYGASLGKMVVKIRIIEIKTLQKPSFWSALNRASFRILSEMIFYLGFLWGVLSPSKQAWHDLSAGTLVVNA
jgi:uncharacterized RDD family membrane protein YckC